MISSLVKENSPIKKPGMQKFLASKISSDKTKKIRLSLERFVPKNKSVSNFESILISILKILLLKIFVF